MPLLLACVENQMLKMEHFLPWAGFCPLHQGVRRNSPRFGFVQKKTPAEAEVLESGAMNLARGPAPPYFAPTSCFFFSAMISSWTTAGTLR